MRLPQFIFDDKKAGTVFSKKCPPPPQFATEELCSFQQQQQSTVYKSPPQFFQPCHKIDVLVLSITCYYITSIHTNLLHCDRCRYHHLPLLAPLCFAILLFTLLYKGTQNVCIKITKINKNMGQYILSG